MKCVFATGLLLLLSASLSGSNGYLSVIARKNASEGGGSTAVARVTGSDTLFSTGATGTHTITVPSGAETMLWFVMGYDSVGTTKLADGTFTLDPGGDDTNITAAVATTGTQSQGGLFIVDVTSYAGGDVDIDWSYATTATWSSGAWHVAVFYENVDMTSLPTSAYSAIGADSHNIDGAELTTGSIATASDGMAVGAYRWFENDGSGAFTSGVTEFLDTGYTSSSTMIVGEAATSGSNVTISGDGGSILFHSIVGVTLKP